MFRMAPGLIIIAYLEQILFSIWNKYNKDCERKLTGNYY